jgi:multiple sugar transport system substrate-binding protein
MNKVMLRIGLMSTALLSFGASAQETVVWWDFLGGGDGVRMRALIDRFNQEHQGEIVIEPTTLEWGVPFYSRVQTATATGEGPDIMTYHLSRIPLGVEQQALAPIDPADLEGVGLSGDDFAQSNWEAAQLDGTLYAVPFDIHAHIMYYNKDALGEAGLLGEDGLPALDGAETFTQALRTLKEAGYEYPLSLHTSDGSTPWRLFYSMLGQQGGEFLVDGEFLPGDNLDKAVAATALIASWVEEGLAPSLVEYPASVALFTSGEAPLHINGVWEVPTMVDLAEKGELGFEWGAAQLPVFFDQPATWADSHAFAIPNNQGREATPEKKAAVLEVIRWMSENSLEWATAGHIPAYAPVRQSEEFQNMEPNATYSVLAETAKFDPRSTLTGVASPTYDAAGNYLAPAINGEIDPQTAMEDMQEDLQDQAD